MGNWRRPRWSKIDHIDRQSTIELGSALAVFVT
jgi:hypothetical protein